jgi:hypothetical protein
MFYAKITVDNEIKATRQRSKVGRNISFVSVISCGAATEVNVSDADGISAFELQIFSKHSKPLSDDYIGKTLTRSLRRVRKEVCIACTIP